VQALTGEPLHDPAGRRDEPKISEALLDKMKAMGWPAEQLAKLRRKGATSDSRVVVEVEPELWDAFRVFRLVHDSQWRRQTLETANGFVTMRQSLDYTAVAAVAKDLGVGGEGFWEQVGAMEMQALAIYRRREMQASRKR
jgi:hypothetical protein